MGYFRYLVLPEASLFMKFPRLSYSPFQKLIALGTLSISVQAANAATFVVTSGANSGTGTLNAAIAGANAATGSSSITFGTAVKEVVLTSALPAISKTLTINGPTTSVTVRSSALSNNFRILGCATSSNVTLKNLILRQGNVPGSSGGAIQNGGTLQITDCTLSGNQAGSGGALANIGGRVTIERCTFSANQATTLGGAIFNAGSITLVNSTLGGNKAVTGGGIYNSPLVTAKISFSSCTLSANEASFSGAGLINDSSTALVLNSTLVAGNKLTSTTANKIDVAGLLSGSYNLIGIFNGGSGFTHNVSGNRLGWASNPLDAKLTALSNNGGPTATFALQQGSPASNTGSTTLLTDQAGKARQNTQTNRDDIGALERNLAPVAGDATFTAKTETAFTAQLPGSDADGDVLRWTVNALPSPFTYDSTTGKISGKPTTVGTFTASFSVTDYRASTATFKIAIVVRPSQSLVVTTAADENDSSSDPDLGTGTSLREAITYANKLAGPSVLSFNLPTANRTVTLNSALPILQSHLSIVGPTSGGGVRVMRGSNAPAFTVFVTGGTSKNITLSNLTISNGNAVRGGAICNQWAHLTVTNCTLTGNTALRGAGVYNETDTGIASTTLRNCTIAGNTAALANDPSIPNGGGVFSIDGRLVIESCTITGNSSLAGQGCGVFVYLQSDETVEISNSIIAGNRVNGSSASGDDFSFSGVTGGASKVTSKGYNLIGDGNGVTFFKASGDKTSIADASLKLGPLQNNGGPTATVALLAGSPAINLGNPAYVTSANDTDQRGPGFPRVKSGRLDIGAFEQAATAPLNVSASPNTGSSSAGTLRTISATYGSEGGANQIIDARILINNGLVATNALAARYASGKLYLYSNDGKSLLGGFAPGNGGVISNGQGSLDCSKTTVAVSGNTLTIRWAFTPAASFTGTKSVYSFVVDAGGQQSSWDKMGTWSITAIGSLRAGSMNEG